MDYYYYKGDKWIGPVSSCFLNDLARSGKIKPDTPVKVNRNILLASSLIGIKFPTEEDKKDPENLLFRLVYWLGIMAAQFISCAYCLIAMALDKDCVNGIFTFSIFFIIFMFSWFIYPPLPRKKQT